MKEPSVSAQLFVSAFNPKSTTPSPYSSSPSLDSPAPTLSLPAAISRRLSDVNCPKPGTDGSSGKEKSKSRIAEASPVSEKSPETHHAGVLELNYKILAHSSGRSSEDIRSVICLLLDR
ncbi:hypothetical protein CDL15_Pgr003003 [Punica granatum]|uniref:Uncharacterized protein n=1 Tax=Punica granatum TaxID=22663 RepID=A0A218X387_PUNGR|nr:hypothetical protein CDL15_Pgr003003 [Punica granatum]